MHLADYAALRPGDVVLVRCTVVPINDALRDAGDYLRLRTIDPRGGLTFYAPTASVESAQRPDIVAALCDEYGRVLAETPSTEAA